MVRGESVEKQVFGDFAVVDDQFVDFGLGRTAAEWGAGGTWEGVRRFHYAWTLELVLERKLRKRPSCHRVRRW